MLWRICSLALFLLLVSPFTVNAEEIDEEDGVLVLTSDNFESAIASHSDIMVEFYAPWCGICKTLAPEYAKAAAMLKSEGSEVMLAKVDATVHEDVAAKFEISGYPTLIFFRSGKPIKYTGGRKADSIVDWINKKSGPVVVQIDSLDALAEFTRDRDVYAVGYFEDQDSLDAIAFTEAAAAVDDLPLAITSDATVGQKLGFVAGTMGVAVMNDEKCERYSGDYEAEAIRKWIEAESVPLVTFLSQQTAQSIFGGETKQFILLRASKKPGNFLALKREFTDAAKQFRHITRYVLVDTADEWSENVMKKLFGASADRSLGVYAISLDDGKMKKFMQDDIVEMTAQSFIVFNKLLIAGDLKQYLRSEEVPDDWDTKNVKIIVGKNFQEAIKNSGKFTLVDFYAPGCRYCKMLEPIWEELGEKFVDSDKVQIAKIDATLNEVDGIQIQGYPTIKYFPAGSEEGIDYRGGRTLNDLVAFVNEELEKEEKKDRTEL